MMKRTFDYTTIRTDFLSVIVVLFTKDVSVPPLIMTNNGMIAAAMSFIDVSVTPFTNSYFFFH